MNACPYVVLTVLLNKRLQDTRLLMTLSKFHQLRSKTIASLVNAISRSLDTDMSRDSDVLIEVLNSMDDMVFRDYVERRMVELVQVVEGGILHEGVDWLNTSKPTGQCSNLRVNRRANV